MSKCALDGCYEFVNGAVEKYCCDLHRQVALTRAAEAEVARLKAALKLKENDEGIWLHVKTEKLEGAVLVAAKDEPRGPIMMAVLRAALAEQEPECAGPFVDIKEENSMTAKTSNQRPRLLDLFCCAGGAGVGYNRAGFKVVGVDIAPQPHFPFEMIQADVLKLDMKFLKSFDAIHASPPCQSYSDLAKRNGNGDEWPRLIEPVREMLMKTGKPYIIENVSGAPMLNPVVLCGTMFKGLRVLRHRLFEANFTIIPPPHGKHPICHTFDKRKPHYGKTNDMVDFVSVNGGGNCTIAAARDAMGIDWMTKDELNESIPPAYTELIGKQLIKHLETLKRSQKKCVSRDQKRGFVSSSLRTSAVL